MKQIGFDFIDGATRHDVPTLAVSEQPPYRIEHFGASAISDTELLAMVIQGNGIGSERAVSMAREIILKAGSLAGLSTWTAGDYGTVKGIGHIKGLQLATLVEISRRMMAVNSPVQPLLNRADAVAAYFAPLVTGLEIEKFWVLCLNRKNRLLKRVEISSGSATATVAHPREIFRAAIRESASALVCVHNHPSGDPAPSAPDLHVTRQIREGARTVDIDLIDHVIIGTPAADPLSRGYFSFRDAGML